MFCPYHFSTQNFNPRSREGSDTKLEGLLTKHFAFQSTLPRRERRSAQVFIVGVQRNFNPRSREGSDVCTLVSMVVAKSFQSTLPRRERHITSAAAAGLAHFNPRSREGSDVAPVVHGRWVFISIHAPAKGATLPPYHEHPRQAISIHAPVKGATPRAASAQTLLAEFQSTLP